MIGKWVVVGVLLCASCASTGSGSTQAKATGAKRVSAEEAEKAKKMAMEGWVCHKERPLGSNIMEEICRPLAEVEREREAAQMQLRNTGSRSAAGK